MYFIFICEGKSFTCITNIIGPKIDSWGTPYLIFPHVDVFITSFCYYCSRFKKNMILKDYSIPFILKCDSCPTIFHGQCYRRPLWKKTPAVCFELFKAFTSAALMFLDFLYSRYWTIVWYNIGFTRPPFPIPQTFVNNC